ncbi:MAG: DNA alkylation repair protein [Clostridia bacterium]|nr:DNA alkylation repair protein [Clostridia bacterium]
MTFVEEKLLEFSDKEYKEFNSKLCPDTQKEMLGIRVPELRKLAQTLLKEYGLQKVLDNSTDQYFEGVLLQGLVIAYSKISFSEKIPYIKEFVPKIDSWAISDTFTPTLKPKNDELELAWNFIIPYTKSDKEFDIRFAVIMMLDYFITEEYVDKVIKELDKIHHNGYYVKMAVAWTIAEIATKFNDKAIKYLQNNNLDNFTHNKAIQKMRESYRISKEQKEFLKTLKRK